MLSPGAFGAAGAPPTMEDEIRAFCVKSRCPRATTLSITEKLKRKQALTKRKSANIDERSFSTGIGSEARRNLCASPKPNGQHLQEHEADVRPEQLGNVHRIARSQYHRN